MKEKGAEEELVKKDDDEEKHLPGVFPVTVIAGAISALAWNFIIS